MTACQRKLHCHLLVGILLSLILYQSAICSPTRSVRQAPPTPAPSTPTTPGGSSSTTTTSPGGSSSTTTTYPGGSSSTTTTSPGGSSSTTTTSPGGSSSTTTTSPGGSSSTTTTSPGGSSSTTTTSPGGSSSTTTTSPGGSSSTTTTSPGGSSSTTSPGGSSSTIAPPGPITEKEVESVSLKITGYSRSSYEGQPCDQALEDFISQAANLEKATPPDYQAIYDELVKVDAAISSPPAPLLCNRFRLMMCISGQCNCAAGTEQRYSYAIKLHSYHCYANSGSCKQDITELIPMLKVDKEEAYKHYGDPSIPPPGGNNQWHNNEEKCLLNVCTRLDTKAEECKIEEDVGLPGSFNDFRGKQQVFANNWEDERRKRSYKAEANKGSRDHRKTFK